MLLSFGLLGAIAPAQGQSSFAKYGAAFLEGGVGARALGMGGTHIALANDVTAGYWNVAGLSGLTYPQAAFMHDERFAGIVSFDYGSIAFPINNRSTFGIAFFRSGVDDIPNTWNAWDPIRDQPLPNPENYVTRFSATDYAFFINYARALSADFTMGVTGKIIRRSIGNFSRAWGYSFDLGARYRVGQFLLGANIQDVSTMLISWSVNQERLRPIEDIFGDTLPEGGSELVLPVARFGTGYIVPLGSDGLTNMVLGVDLDFRFDGLESYSLNGGGMSFHPRIGTEFNFKNVISLRAGLGNVQRSDDLGLQVTPSVGTGIKFKQIALDYGFGDFSGTTSELGMSHRISLMLTLEQPRMRRVVQ